MKRGELWAVDTNVPITANGRSENGKPPTVACRLAATEFLLMLKEKGKIVLDEAGIVQQEYRAHLYPSGQPGVGDQFYREVLNSHPDRIERFHLPVAPNDEYEDLPPAIVASTFDRNDRKFAALAIRTGAVVANATDSDWVIFRGLIAAAGVSVINLCGCTPAGWFET